MSDQVLNEKIGTCISDDSGVEIYFLMKDESLRKANFIPETQIEIKDLFVERLKEQIIDRDYDIIDFSNADNRNNAIYKYDLELGDDLLFFEEILSPDSTIPSFSFDDDLLSEIKAFVLLIGVVDHQLVLYKQFAPVNLYKKTRKSFYVRKSERSFKSVESELIRIIPGVDLLYLNDNLYVLNLNVFETVFKVHDIIKASASHQIEIINASGLIENAEKLNEMLDDISFARKLSKAAENSPVLNKVSNDLIITFTKNHPVLHKVFKYDDAEAKIKLTSKKSMNHLIKLLNDDYLNSDLTSIYYDSMSKNTLNDASN